MASAAQHMGSSAGLPAAAPCQVPRKNTNQVEAPDALATMPALDSHFAGAEQGMVSYWRAHTRQFWAEFLGTAILVLFGTGVNNQVTLGHSSALTSVPRGDWSTVCFGWGVAIMLGVVVSGGISGGHINPAITLTLALLRGFPWKKVPIYWLAQFLGAFFGASLVYLNFHRAISIYEGGPNIRTVGGTGGLFFTNPLSYMSNLGCFYNELLMTAILMMFICAIGDKGNLAPPKGVGSLAIPWVVFAIASTLGMQTSFSLNPARDIGPRLLTWAAGYGIGVWHIRSGYWFWCATLGPVCGAFIGCFLYDFLVGTEDVESPIRSTGLASWFRKVRGLETMPDHERSRYQSGQQLVGSPHNKGVDDSD